MSEPIAINPGRAAASRPSRAHCGRVLYLITSSGFGGAEKIVEKVITGIDRDAFDPVLCSLHSLEEIGRQIEAAGIPVISLDMPREKRLAVMWKASRAVAELIDRLEIDLVHSFLYRANVLARLGGRLAKRRPVVCSGHHSVTPSRQGRTGMLLEAMTHRLSDWCIAVSEPVRERVVERQKASRERTVIIANGIDTDYFRRQDALAARRRLDLPADGFLVGGVGRLSQVKAFGDLIDAVAIAREEGVNAELVLAGGGEDEDDLREHAHRAQIADHVCFVGVQSDLRPVYSALDVFALSSLDEASPTVVLEAMSCECAVVTTRVGGAMTMIEDDRCGLVVERSAPRQLANALVRLADDPALRRRLADEARRRVVERFDVGRMVDDHQSFYRSVLAQRRGFDVSVGQSTSDQAPARAAQDEAASTNTRTRKGR